MKNEHKTKQQLISELAELRQRVAELEASEAERRQAGKLYESIVELAPDSIITLDMKGMITSCNPAATRILGYSKDELIGKHFSKLGVVRARDIPKFLKLFKSALRGELIKPLELGFRRKDGAFILAEVRVGLLKKNGKTIGLQAISTDITERKRAAEALRVSEERFALAVRGSDAGLWDWDIQNNSLYWSPRLKELLGYADDELDVDFDTFESLLHPDDREHTGAAIEAHLKDRGLYEVEQRLRTKSGEYRWFRARGQALWDEAGNPLRMIGFTTDITERKRAEEALRESEERFRSYFKLGLIGIAIASPEREWLEVNDRLSEILGYSRDGLLSMTWDQPTYPEDVALNMAQIERVLAGEIDAFSLEKRFVRKDGEIIRANISTRCIRRPDGSVDYFVTLIQDITERKRAEEALRSLAKATVGVTGQECFDRIVSELCKYFAANCGIVGQIIDKETVRALSMELDGEKVRDYEYWLQGTPCENVVEKGTCLFPQGVCDLFPDDRDLADMKAKGYVGTPIRDRSGNVLGILCAISRHSIEEKREWRDVIDIMAARAAAEIERKRAEEALKEYSEHLEEMVDERTKELRDAQEQLVRKEKLAVLGQMAGGVGHELRNPLGVISNAVYFLQMTLPDADESTKESLEIISEEVRNSTKIISDLLDFSRTKMPDREEIAVSELVAEVLEKRPPPEGVEAIAELAPDLPPVFVDPRQMGQVLGNLVVNAYQAMKEGGKLTIGAQAEESQVSISIGDTGCGIPPENLAKIFEPLFTTKARGIGLGLAVSKSLVEANGGSIEVASEVGKSSTFTVRLPLAGGRGDT